MSYLIMKINNNLLPEKLFKKFPIECNCYLHWLFYPDETFFFS